ncbi:MAG: hypothetical protein ABSC06_34325, partial [Rhodopila sp.]
RIPLFSLSLATSVCSYTAQILAYVSIPFMLQTVMHRTPVATGLLVTPWPLLVAVAAPMAGRLSARYPAGASGDDRAGGAGERVTAAGVLASGAGGLGHCLADGDVRDWVRLLPDAEQHHGDDGRTSGSDRCGRGDDVGGPDGWLVAGVGAGGTDLCDWVGEGNGGLFGGGGRICSVCSGDQQQSVVGGALRIPGLAKATGWRRRLTSRQVRRAEAEVVRGPAASANADGPGRSLLRSDFCRYARHTCCA